MRLRLGALPLLADLRRPDSRPCRDDVAAGLLTAALLLPQALAYAQLAGLPARAGVLASLLPAIVYALFGRSRALAVGPVAVAALMVAEALARHAPEAALVSTAAVILAAEVGLLLLLLRGLRWGGLVALISHPVLLGFTAGAALLILLSQLAPLLGLALPRAGPLATLQAAAQRPSDAVSTSAQAGDAAEEALAGDGAIEHGVADDDVLFRCERADARRINDQPAAGHALAGIVIGIALQEEGDTAAEKCAETLPGGARKVGLDRVFRQAGMAVAFGYFAR